MCIHVLNALKAFRSQLIWSFYADNRIYVRKIPQVSGIRHLYNAKGLHQLQKELIDPDDYESFDRVLL